MQKNLDQLMEFLASLEDLEGLAGRMRKGIAAEVDTLRMYANGQRDLPGLGGSTPADSIDADDGEELVGAAALERRIKELEGCVSELGKENRELHSANSELRTLNSELSSAMRRAVGHLGNLAMAASTRCRCAQIVLERELGKTVAERPDCDVSGVAAQ